MKRSEDLHTFPPGHPGGAQRPPHFGHSLVRDAADGFFRNWRWLALFAALTIAALAAYARFTPPDYESEMTFLVRNNRADVIVSPDGSTTAQQRQTDVSDAQIATEVQMLSSRDLALELLPIAGFTGGSELDQERALAKLQKNIQISPIMKSNMIRVRYTSPDQKKATQVLNVLAKSYLDRHLELHGDTGSFQFFDGQSTAAERRLKEAQSKLVGFQRTSGEANVLETKDLVLRRQIELQVTLNQAEAELKDTTRRIESIRPRLQQLALRIPTTARRVPNQYSAERMSTLLTELQNRRTELLVKYRPTERIVIQLEQQITDTRKALLEAEGRVSTEEVSDVNPLRQALESELSRAESTEAGLRGRIQAMRGQEQAYRDQLTKLEALSPIEQQYKRDAKVAEDNYLLYAKKREEARIGQSMDQQKISNVVLAERPRAAALPKSRTATLVAAFVLALLLGLVAAILASRMRRTVQTPWDLESVSDVPVVGTVPVQSAPVLPERLRGLQS